MRLSSATTALVAALVSSLASADSIYDIAKGNPDFSTLAAAVDAAGLDTALSGPGNFTVFAPPNSAFAKLDEEVVAKLLKPEWNHHLQDVLLYHALATPVYSTDLTDGATAETLNGEDILINLNPPRINDASNINLDLVDIQADNGVIHAIDTVLLPASATNNIVQLGQANPEFSTLVDLVVAADLVDALSGDGPLTLFAPTNDAFAKLPDGTIEDLKKPENKDTLVGILTYHVVGANVASSDLKDGPVETLNGQSVEIKTNPPMVNDAKIMDADILANNGIIHVLDSVLLPVEEGESSAPTKAPTEKDGESSAPTKAPTEKEGESSAPTKAPTDEKTTSAPTDAKTTSAPTAAPSGANVHVLSFGALAAGAISFSFF